MASLYSVRDLFVICALTVFIFVLPAKAFADRILVQGDSNYPPYEFLDNGIPSGFNIDIMREVAAIMGLKIKIDLGTWDDVRSSIEAGRIDALTGMYFSPERAQLIEFSTPHNIVSHTIFVRLESSIRSLDDLSNKQILVQRGDIMHDYAVKHFPKATIIPVESQIQALKLLSSGKYDAALLGKLQNLFWATKEGITNVMTIGPPLKPTEYCFAVRKGDKKLLSQLNEGLSLLKNSGKYDNIYNKWFGVYERKSIYLEVIRYISWIMAPVLAFLVFFVFWAWLLKHKVKKKTAELTAELLERRRIEKKLIKVQSYLTNIIDSMPSILIGIDQNGFITQWNKEAERVIKLSMKEAIGQPLDIAVPFLSEEMNLIKNNKKDRLKQVGRKRSWSKDGEKLYQCVTIYPLVANGVEGAVIRIDNITDRTHMDQMLMQSEKMMSLGGLAGGMAHEINNPLAVVLGSIQNINRRIFSDSLQNAKIAKECDVSLENIQKYLIKQQIPKMLDSIYASGNRAAQIVSNMLSFSRKSGKVLECNNIAEILNRTLELVSNDYDLAKEYDFKMIKVIRDYDLDVPAVFCVANELQQVFLNLLKNGAEAMFEKKYSDSSPVFSLRIKQKGYTVVIEIEDNGPGIDEIGLKRLFEPFYTTKKLGKGTGLGLSVSYFIINEQHSGTMEVSSLIGHWTRFTITLPLCDKCE
ncbi:MAG: histidine kinase [Desulfovibrio sp. S3730MH75]|nr:MAG: histidine kinase [Desulfovibrio sp. S3730MH75]